MVISEWKKSGRQTLEQTIHSLGRGLRSSQIQKLCLIGTSYPGKCLTRINPFGFMSFSKSNGSGKNSWLRGTGRFGPGSTPVLDLGSGLELRVVGSRSGSGSTLSESA